MEGNDRDDLKWLAAALEILETVEVQKKCRKLIIGSHGSKCGIQGTAPQQIVKIRSPAFASHTSMDHASFEPSLVSHSQVADMGNNCPEGCVHVAHSAVAGRGTFTVDQVNLRLLTKR